MGYDMAKYLSTYNFDLFLVAKDKKELDKKFKDLKNKIKTYGFDLSKEEECIKLYKEVRNENIDILINNAGLALDRFFLIYAGCGSSFGRSRFFVARRLARG